MELQSCPVSFRRVLALLIGLLASVSPSDAITPISREESEARRLAPLALAMPHVSSMEWSALLPPSQRDHFSTIPPPPVHDYLGEGGRAITQRGSAEVNKDLAGAHLRLPGFIVPLAVAADGKISEFFLVPYLGACIHVPPPPPNQIVYVKTAQPFTLSSLDQAYWITGTLRMQAQQSRFGVAAYALQADKVEIYKN